MVCDLLANLFVLSRGTRHCSQLSPTVEHIPVATVRQFASWNLYSICFIVVFASGPICFVFVFAKQPVGELKPWYCNLLVAT